jgi:hypothetical protein
VAARARGYCLLEPIHPQVPLPCDQLVLAVEFGPADGGLPLSFYAKGFDGRIDDPNAKSVRPTKLGDPNNESGIIALSPSRRSTDRNRSEKIEPVPRTTNVVGDQARPDPSVNAQVAWPKAAVTSAPPNQSRFPAVASTSLSV